MDRMLKTCRFCDCEDQTVVNNVQDYSYDIQLIAQMKVNLHPNLPQKMCDYCVSKVKEAVSFRALCRRSEEILLTNYLIEDEGEIIVKAECGDWDADTVEVQVYDEDDVKQESPTNEPLVMSYEELQPEYNIKEEVMDEEFDNIEMLDEVLAPSKPRGRRGRKKGIQPKFESIHEILRKTNQPKEGPWKCEPCNKIYTVKSSFHSHYRDFHADELRRFVCDICGISYTRRITLQDHLNVHRNVRPFSCEICGAAFTRKYAVQKHMQCHMPNEAKKFKCKYCQKGFSFWIDHRRHLTSHTGLYIYYCAFCNKGFNRKKHKEEHEAKHFENNDGLDPTGQEIII